MLHKLFTHFLIAFLSALITVGLIVKNPIVIIALTIVFAMIASHLLFTWIEFLIKFIYNSKKKMKNKRKEVKLKATFRYEKVGVRKTFQHIIIGDSIESCIGSAMKFARDHGYTVTSLDLLTTE